MLFFLIKCQLKIEGTNRKYTYPSLKVSPHKLLRNNQKKKKVNSQWRNPGEPA